VVRATILMIYNIFCNNLTRFRIEQDSHSDRFQGNQGREEGKIEGERMVLLRQIKRRFGELTSATIVLIERLNSQYLTRLEEAMWDFYTIEDLLKWLEESSNLS
jgi:hypothetical protein